MSGFRESWPYNEAPYTSPDDNRRRSLSELDGLCDVALELRRRKGEGIVLSFLGIMFNEAAE